MAYADADAVVEADTDAAEGGAYAVPLDGENSDDDSWNITGDDDVPLLKRRMRHRLQSKPKRVRVVLSDDDSPWEERQPRITAADKGKSKVEEAPAKATIRRCTSNKKRKNDGDPGSSTGAAKKEKKKTPNKDNIMVNEALGIDDDYAEAADLIPSFPEKAKPKDPTLHNPNSRPPSPRSKDSKKRRWCAEAAAGVYKGAANYCKRMHRGGGGRHAHYPDMEAALYHYVCLQRANGVAILVKDTQKWSHEWMKKHHPSKNWNASSHWSQRFSDHWNLVMRVKTTVGQRLSAGYEKTRLVVMLVCTAFGEKLRPWVWFKLKNVPNCEIPEGQRLDGRERRADLADQGGAAHLNPQRGQNARRAMLVLDSYHGHITQTMLQAYRTHSITPAVIPTGSTSQIQPLDVSINRCFKAAVRARYARWFMREGIHLKTKAGNQRRPPHPVVLQWIAEVWDQVPKKVIIEAFRHCAISSKLDMTENHLVMSHLRARSTTDVSEDMCLGGTTGDNTRLLGHALEEEEMQAEGMREVAVATSLGVLYQETPNYRGVAAEADRMIEHRETARHVWGVSDLGVMEHAVSAGEEAVTEGG
ncbi:unnamed protein product [Closterium sp. NIES-54]